jgi:hypothetical protein
MHRTSHRLRRCATLVVVLAVAVLVGRRLAGAPGGAADRFAPITGDTWPPVPVKPAAPA